MTRVRIGAFQEAAAGAPGSKPHRVAAPGSPSRTFEIPAPDARINSSRAGVFKEAVKVGSCLAAAAYLFLTGSSLAAQGGGLEPSVKIEAGGQPIDVEVGHAAPAMADLDGDG